MNIQLLLCSYSCVIKNKCLYYFLNLIFFFEIKVSLYFIKKKPKLKLDVKTLKNSNKIDNPFKKIKKSNLSELSEQTVE